MHMDHTLQQDCFLPRLAGRKTQPRPPPSLSVESGLNMGVGWLARKLTGALSIVSDKSNERRSDFLCALQFLASTSSCMKLARLLTKDGTFDRLQSSALFQDLNTPPRDSMCRGEEDG